MAFSGWLAAVRMFECSYTGLIWLERLTDLSAQYQAE
jgi:hypothetical protein